MVSRWQVALTAIAAALLTLAAVACMPSATGGGQTFGLTTVYGVWGGDVGGQTLRALQALQSGGAAPNVDALPPLSPITEEALPPLPPIAEDATIDELVDTVSKADAMPPSPDPLPPPDVKRLVYPLGIMLIAATVVAFTAIMGSRRRRRRR